MLKFGEFPVGLRALLPLLAAAALLLAPRATGLDGAFEGVRRADAARQPQDGAALRVNLAQWEPWRVDLWQQAGELALLAGRPETAIADLEQARRLGHLDDAGRLSLGEAYWMVRQPEQALAVWQPLLSAGRASRETYRRVVQYQRERADWTAAEQTARAWWQADAGSGQAAWTSGVLSLALGGEADLALQLAGSLDPARAGAGQVLLRAARQVEATAPEEYRALQVGRALGSVGEWELALVAFERAKRSNPVYAEAWAFSGEARQHLRQDGWPDLERSLELAPDSAALQAMAGLYFRRQGDARQALQHFISAAELEPRRAIWQVEIGSSYADLHNTRKGLEFYAKATELEPQNSQIWQLTALYCLNHDLAVRESGLPAARQMAVLAPDDPASADLMAMVLLALGDEASAERFLQLSLVQDGQYPAALLHLGQLYLRLGRLEWSEYYLARAAQFSVDGVESALLAQRLLVRYFR